MSEGGAGQGGCGGGEGAKRRQRSPARPSACIFGEKRTAWSGRGGGLRSSGAAAESVGRLSCVTELPKLRERPGCWSKARPIVTTLNHHPYYGDGPRSGSSC